MNSSQKLRICFDLDGTICHLKQPNQSYAELKPIEQAVQKIQTLKAQGHTIIIHTARNMATQKANLGKVMQNIGLITLNWLKENNIPYDEIYFGKPNAHITIDDRCFRFQSWDEIDEKLIVKYAKAK